MLMLHSWCSDLAHIALLSGMTRGSKDFRAAERTGAPDLPVGRGCRPGFFFLLLFF